MVFLLGVSGPTSAGKTFFTEMLKSKCWERGISLSIISTDDFYIDRSHQKFEIRAKANYDEPSSIDKVEFLECLENLRVGKEMEVPIYDYTQHNRSGNFRKISASDLIIVEGIFTYSFEEILSMYNLKLYVDLESDLRLIRRITRDTQERGRSIESVVNQYLTTIKPTQAKFVQQNRDIADIIVRGDANHKVVIDMILTFIQNRHI